MLLTTTKEQLIDSITTLNSCVPESKSLPDIYGYVRFNTFNSVIIAQATNKVITVSSAFEGESDVESFCLPLKRLAKLVPLLDDEKPITIEEKDGWAYLRSGKSKHKLPMRKSEDFPAPNAESQKEFRMPLSKFYKMLRLANLATSKSDEASWKLACINIKVRGNSITFEACDGKQIARVNSELDDSFADSDLLIPQLAINTLLKFIKEKTDDDIEIEICSNYVKFRKPTETLLITLTTGVFPDVGKIIQETYQTVLTTSVDKLLLGIERVITADDGRGYVFVKCSEESIVLDTQAHNNGEGQEVLELLESNGPAEFIMVHKPVINFLKEVKGKVKIGLGTDKDPITFWEEEEGDITFRFLTMPVNIGNAVAG